MDSLRALAHKEIPIEFKHFLLYTIIVTSFLSMFRASRWWVFFVIKALWRVCFNCWIDYFLAPNIDNDAILRSLLDARPTESEPTRSERWQWLLSRTTKKQICRINNRDTEKESEEKIWRGLVVSDGTRFLDLDDSHVANSARRRSWGIVEYAFEESSDSVTGPGGRTVSSMGHARVESTSSLTSATDNSGQQLGQGQAGTFRRRKKKNKSRVK